VITNLAINIFFLLKTTTMAKTRSCVGWNINVVCDVTPLGRKSTSLLRSRTDGRIKFQEAGYPEMLVCVYSMPPYVFMAQRSVKQRSQPYRITTTCVPKLNPHYYSVVSERERERDRERDIPLAADTFISVHCLLS